MSDRGKVVAICTSETKGVRKTPVERVELVVGRGLSGDAHAGPWHRQVSLLALESIDKMRQKGLQVGPGDFAENLTTRGINLPSLPIGTVLTIGQAVLSITQIGKECHTRCAIYHQAGDCVMPREGIFAEVLRGGHIETGQSIEVWSPFRARVITMSDRCYRGETKDESGPALAAELSLLGAEVQVSVLPDEAEELEGLLQELTWSGETDLVLTTGGTGLSPRDVTPEATLRVIERATPGISEAIRAESMRITPHAMLSRGVSGIAGRTLIVNLPGSQKGALESFAILRQVLPHALETLRGQTTDCGRGD
jgi:molybdenum cofactor synthesis domain-containing protein